MLNETELQDLMGRDVLDRDGKTIGQVECFYNDKETGRPEWIGVFTGTFRTHHFLVPVEGATREATGLRVPWPKEQVHAAPDYGKPDEPISEEMEREAYRHYGLRSAV
jgi:sporulation protein YlmC with PRC-barrel domain